MKRHLVAFAVLTCLGAPALADTCAAATEAATRAALDSAAAAGRRTATVRITCEGQRQTFVLHRSQGASGASVTVRQVKPVDTAGGLSGEARSSGGSSQARIIRVGE